MESWEASKEEEILKFWESQELFKIGGGRNIFSIDTPPPYPTGIFHIAQTIHYLQIDMIARAMRMMGKQVLFPLGIDRNGLPVENYVERKTGINIRNASREEFLRICSLELDEMEKKIVEALKRGGMSCDFDNLYRTDSPEYRKLTQQVFLDFFRRGLIYEDYRPVNYCPVCRTTIADTEVEYSRRKVKLYYIKFKVEGEEREVVIATTRPELLCSCLFVIYNPRDKRYRGLENKQLVVPIFSRRVPVFKHRSAKPEFGTGLVMICSYGDSTDIRLVKEFGVRPIVAIDEDARMNENAGPYKGLKVEEARAKIVEDLEKLGAIEKEEEIEQDVPCCWRSKNPIEFIELKEFYLRQLDFIPKLKKIIGEMRFYPKDARKILLSWVNSLSSDWPISRRRYYGTEIPLWYCKKCKQIILPEGDKYFIPWKENPPLEKCPKCGSREFVGEERVFDTWMDSSCSELFILKYRQDPEFFQENFPCTMRVQGKDIIKSWLYYSILVGFHVTGKPVFKHVWCSGLGLDEKGRPMHKSLGNVVYPLDLFNKYGADAVRFFGASEVRHGENYKVNERKIQGSSKFLQKLWQISRFVRQFEKPRVSKLEFSDQWIISCMNELIRKCRRSYRKFDLFTVATQIRSFVWNLFAPHYIELVKPRAYGGNEFSSQEVNSARYTLHYCLEAIIKLLAPICPFICEAIWLSLGNKESIHKQKFPKVKKVQDLSKFTKLLVEFNSQVWKFKKENKLPLNAEIERFICSTGLKGFEKDLKAMHKIRNLEFK
ncbi:MAG: valine--tRNA ligase [Candidatus Nanoarchaeia archaeon]|nr:valine--tRNA ligase [Candidatus Haiyanarchaeum thermophilum]MCW1302838.1 valine--tRNA ligase [Candidatus Haiyanarchaeum thermophilum]MCW1303518.1 valine--tRNA ligase [Candidatus Haiyanarchaeum thermophilum]MCW1306698.1 valine--tRNA ligase [Candidatus Haiyanarchaeum thermophilum]MCW1307346.1 valine--tRNA ligase [Candidatus Haiyanarchaeum thermophilum]